MAGELPGMNVLQVLAAAPIDLLNLGVKQLSEFVSVANAGVTNLGAQLAVPPALPTGLPQLPMGLPALPDLSALLPGAGTAGGASAQAAFGEIAKVTRKPPRLII